MSIEQIYRRDTFREIRPCAEMDLIRKAMARRAERERKRKDMQVCAFWLAAFVAAVSAAVWILR